jgi:hypothetical protein
MRDDLSNKLVHLAKGTNDDLKKHREEAVNTLHNILTEKRLRGGTGFIKGGSRCVCFSESPIGKLSHLLAENDQGRFKYQPYGVLLDKLSLYRQGGRPVIYGPDYDYTNLPDDMKYRHVRFWLGDDYTIDHTWEREWRIKTDSLPIHPSEVTIVVPDRIAKDFFVNEFSNEAWHYMVLSDLGVKIDAL